MIVKIKFLSQVVLLNETIKTHWPLATTTVIVHEHTKTTLQDSLGKTKVFKTLGKPTSSVQQPAVLLLVSDQDLPPEMNTLRGFLALHVPCLRVSHSISACKRSSINRQHHQPNTKDLTILKSANQNSNRKEKASTIPPNIEKKQS